MRTIFSSAALAVVLCGAMAEAAIEADARRGAEVLTNQKCTTCHSIDGKGKGTAPDLGRRLDRDYTPAGLTSRMWNHAPTMWSVMKQQNVPVPQLSDRDAADLFAYLYTSRFFEKPGDAARGKRAFAAKHCTQCHALSGAGGPGKPIAEWQNLNDPIALLNRMWNHAPQMEAEVAKHQFKWASMSEQDLTDILVYLQNLPATKNAPVAFSIAGSAEGKELFHNRCEGCHNGSKSLQQRIANKTLTEIAADMWNHAPRMAPKAGTLELDDMKKIISFVWVSSYFQASGDTAHGKHVFTAKGCAGCHDQGGGPAITKPADGFGATTLVSALWKHGPQMQERMKQSGKEWPQLSAADTANLIAYLNSR